MLAAKTTNVCSLVPLGKFMWCVSVVIVLCGTLASTSVPTWIQEYLEKECVLFFGFFVNTAPRCELLLNGPRLDIHDEKYAAYWWQLYGGILRRIGSLRMCAHQTYHMRLV